MDDRVYTFIRKGQALRKQYSRHVSACNGLGLLLAGTVSWLICLLICLIGPGILMALLTLALVVGWTYSTGRIKRKCYPPIEKVREPVFQFTPGLKKLGITLMTSFALAVYVLLIVTGQIFDSYLWPSLPIIALMPFVARRYLLHTPFDFLAGFYLWLLCALAMTGLPLGLIPENLALLFMMGVELFTFGLWSHLEYRLLVKDVKELRYGHQRSITQS